MKTFKLMIAIVLIAGFAQRLLAQDQTCGLYLTAEDYHNHKLSYKTTGNDGNIVQLNEFLGSRKVVVVYNGKKEVLYKSAIYGYKYNSTDYRYFNNSSYKIIDDKDFYLYSAHKLVQQGKGPKAINTYYFSTTAVADIKPLSIKNLQSTFADNARFRYLLDSQFSTDNSLTAYDSAANEYKVKYLYEHTSSM